ncbi:serine hydrolase [soil metagenome]
MWRACVFAFLATYSGLEARAGIETAQRYSDQHGGRAFLVWQNGQIVRESYAHGGSQARGENIYSITKSLAALGIFSAISKDWMKLDTPACQFLPTWKKSPGKSAITVRELLDQTSGLASGYEKLYAKSLRDKRTAALAVPLVNRPGEVFAYGPSNYETLEALMASCLEKSPHQWLLDTVLTPIGVKPIQWRKDRLDHPFFSAGAYLTARDLLSVGQLVRRKGARWIFPVFPSLLMDIAAQGSPANRMYGLGFWLNHGVLQQGGVERDVEEAISQPLSREDWAHSCLSRRAPSDLIAMVGSNGQRVYVSTAQNIIIVRLGVRGGFRDPDFLQAFFR